MAKITGIGGVFFKAKTDDKALEANGTKNISALSLQSGAAPPLGGPRIKQKIRVLRHGRSLSRPQNGSVQVNHPS